MQIGFGNFFQSEAIEGSLPRDQNNPQKCPYNLHTEQLSGTAFTRPREFNKSVWMYRCLPSVKHFANGYDPYEELQCAKDSKTLKIDPNPGRWFPPTLDSSSPSIDFVEGLRLFGQAGDAGLCEGLSIYQYNFNKSMTKRSISFCDGDFLIVPQRGKIHVRTELGEFLVSPEEICVIPRGIKFNICLNNNDESSSKETYRGYAVEVYNEGGFRLPELGPIGANGLANRLHFEVPKASFETTNYNNGWEHVKKLAGEWFRQKELNHSPFDVVAWKGNMVPYKYDLRKYCTINTVSYDHPDPSIFTVLTVPTATPGVAACDFVIFPARWMVATNTFRPPYFHRNCMCEFMGLISGDYDGKTGGGFVPGGASLHNRNIAHGPDSNAVEKATNAKLEPVYLNSGLAFMFETAYFLKTTEYARLGNHRDVEYVKCWAGVKRANL